MWRNSRLKSCPLAAGVVALVFATGQVLAQSDQGAGGAGGAGGTAAGGAGGQAAGGASGAGGAIDQGGFGAQGGTYGRWGGFPQRPPAMTQPGQSGFGVQGGLEGQADFGADGFGDAQGDFEPRARTGFRRDRRTQFGTDTQFDNNIQGDFDRRRARRDQANRFGTDTDFDNRVVGGGVDRRSRFSQGRAGTFGDFVAERAGRAARARFDDRFDARLDADFDDEFGARLDGDFDDQFDARFDDFDQQFDDVEGRVFDERDFGGRRPGFRDDRRNFANRRAADIRDPDFDFNRFDDDFDRAEASGDVSARFRGNLRSSLGLAFERGGGSELVLSNVLSGSLAADAGMQPGDEILAANGQRIRNFGDLVSMLRANRTSEPVELIIDRDGRRQTLTLALPEDFLVGDTARFDAFGERVSREARRRNALRRSQPFGDF